MGNLFSFSFAIFLHCPCQNEEIPRMGREISRRGSGRTPTLSSKGRADPHLNEFFRLPKLSLTKKEKTRKRKPSLFAKEGAGTRT